MKFSFRRKAAKTVGYRVNQWRGPRAVQVTDHRRRVRHARLATRCHRVLRLTGWLAVTAVGLWIGITMFRIVEPIIQRGLEIREVRVEGVHQVTKEDVLARLALKQGAALHQVSLSFLAGRLQGHPWIKEATVERLPLHELRVTIVERKPAAIVRTEIEHILTDEEGTVLVRFGEQDNTAFPLLTGLDQKGLLLGERRLQERIRSSIELAKRMAHSVNGRIEIDLTHPTNLVASTKSIRFHFGNDALMDQWDRFMRVKAVSRMTLLEGKRREGSEVDLRWDNRVVVRERG